MTYRTKTESRYYDNSLYWRIFNTGSTPGDWLLGSTLKEEKISSRLADYPDWDWAACIRQGTNVCSSMSATRVRYSCSTGITGADRVTGEPPVRASVPQYILEQDWTNDIHGDPIPNTFVDRESRGYPDRFFLDTWRDDPSLYAEVDNRALMGFFKKALAAQQDLKGSVVVGEFGETLKMFTGRARAFRKGLDSYLDTVKKRCRKARKETPKQRFKRYNRTLSDTWLEYSFGWSPLLSDIDDAAKAIANAQYKWVCRDPVSYTAHGETRVLSDPSYAYSITYNVFHQRLERIWQRCFISIRYYGTVFPSFRGEETLTRRFGLSLQDFIPTVWELIPYSFLVDYFSNVGEIIEAYSHPDLGLRWVNKGQKIFQENWWDYAQGGLLAIPGREQRIAVMVPGTRSSLTKTTLNRGVYQGSLIPSLEFEIPGLGRKWINMSALLFTSQRLSASLRG